MNNPMISGMRESDLERPFPLNAWYVAAHSNEVDQSLLARKICDIPVVLYRLDNGRPAALEDLCCHRMLPLSHGEIKEDLVVCGYHGLAFDANGRCVEVPSQDNVTPGSKVRSFPVEERYGFVWIWMGNTELADAIDIPHLDWCESQDWTGGGEVTLFKCDYRLILDNLLDLTHETYVHSSSIGHTLLPKMPFDTETSEESVTVSRWTLQHEAPPFWKNLLKKARGFEGLCDRWQIAKFMPPCHMRIEVGVAEANTGAPEGDRSKGIEVIVFDTITPASPTTCWYFWTISRKFDVENTNLTETMVSENSKIFEEDRVVLEAQQNAILANPNFSTTYINVDKGPTQMRKIISQAVEQERVL